MLRKILSLAAILLAAGYSYASEVGTYPNATALSGSERLLSDQGGVTVDITPMQIEAWLFPSGFLPASLMPSLTGDCTTTSGSFATTCTKSNGVAFSSLATAPTATAVIGLFTGCTGSDYLGADGVCHAPGGGGSVTSIGVTVPNYLTVSPSTISSSGTFAIAGATLSANQVIASPNGSAGPAAARALVAQDLPSISLTSGVAGVLSVANGGTGHNSITGILVGTGTSAFTTALYSNITQLWSGTCSPATYLRGDGVCSTPSGSGTVNSVGITMPSIFSIGGTNPITNTGTLAVTFATGQTANQFLATPNGTTGASGLRAIVGADLPPINLASSANGGVTGNLPVSNLFAGTGASSSTYLSGTGWSAPPGAVPSVGLSVPAGFSVANSPLTAAGTLAISFATGQTANRFFATPSGSTGAASLRAITTLDLPNIPTSQLTGVVAAVNGGTGENGTITGIPYANGTAAFTQAVAGNITQLFGGSCSASTYLRGDGSCNTPGGGGTVTSVGLTVPSWLAASPSAITSSGVIAITGVSQAANTFLASPDGSTGAVSPRAIVVDDLPAIPTSILSGTILGANFPTLTGDVSNTGLATIVSKINGGQVPISSPLLATNANGQLVTTGSTGTGSAVLQTGATLIAPNLGTPSSVVLTNGTGLSLNTGVGGVLGVANGGSGAVSLFGPLKGNGTSAFTAALSSDIIGLWTGVCNASAYLRADGTCNAPSGSGSVTSVGMTVPSWLTVTGSPITGSGVLAVSTTAQTQGLFLASPVSGSGPMVPRAIQASDLPAQGGSTLFVTVNTNTTLSATNTSVLVDASSAPITITLPTAVGATNLFYVKKIDSSSHAVTIVTTSGQTIDGQSSSGMQNQYTSVTFKSDNANWWQV